jgi:hypothetical protein
LRLLAKPDIEASTVKASRSPDQGFRALATYKEFEKVILGRVSRSAADKQTVQARKMYEKILKQAQREYRDTKSVSSLRYWAGIFMRVSITLVLLALLYVGFTLMVAGLKTLFG